MDSNQNQKDEAVSLGQTGLNPTGHAETSDSQTPTAPQTNENYPQDLEHVSETSLDTKPEQLSQQEPESNPYTQVASNSSSEVPALVDKPKKGSKFLLFIPVILIVFLVAVGGVSYAVAYDKVQIDNPKVTAVVRSLVMSLPFTPKTTKYVLEKAAINTSKYSSYEIDASIAVGDNLDVKIQGWLDYSDPKNVKSKNRIVAGNLIDLDLMASSEKIFFRLNKVPSDLVSLDFRADPKLFETLINRWVSYTTNTLETEARKASGEMSDENQRQLAQSFEKLIANDQIMKKFEMKEEILNGLEVYTISPKIDREFIEFSISLLPEDLVPASFSYEKLEDFYESMDISLSFSKKNYYLVQARVGASYNSNNTPLEPLTPLIGGPSQSRQNLVVVASFSKHGEKFDYNPPKDFVDSATWLNEVRSIIYTPLPDEEGKLEPVPSLIFSFDPGYSFAKARDTQRSADLYAITNSIYQFAAEHNGELPSVESKNGLNNFPTSLTCIGTALDCFDLASAGNFKSNPNSKSAKNPIVPTYISKIPYDPATGTDLNTKYYIYIDANGRVKAQATGETTPLITVTR